MPAYFSQTKSGSEKQDGNGEQEKLASDAAFAQVIRAANVYRGRLGYAPLGPDGWPEQGEATP